MKVLLILALLSQEWILIKEMSGDIPNHPGLTIETYASEIARDGDIIKIQMRFDFPNGSPVEMFRKNAPSGIDLSSISRVEGGLKLDCKTLIVKATGNSAIVYHSQGKRDKSKEPPFKIESGNILGLYFCEQPSKPATVAPTLKPK